MSLTTEQLYEKLREIAPNVVFVTTKELDPYVSWDGDGPNPRDEGLSPYDVKFSAKAIVGGEMIEGTAYLGECWMAPDEELDDVNGYLPQKLEEAAEELRRELRGKDSDNHIGEQITAVVAFIKQELRVRYDEQRAEIEAGRT